MIQYRIIRDPEADIEDVLASFKEDFFYTTKASKKVQISEEVKAEIGLLFLIEELKGIGNTIVPPTIKTLSSKVIYFTEELYIKISHTDLIKAYRKGLNNWVANTYSTDTDEEE